MNEYFYRVKEFYRRNRSLIIGTLAFLLFMQICSRGSKVETNSELRKSPAAEETVRFDSLPDGKESLEQVFYEEMTKPVPEPQPVYYPLLLMTAVVLLFYLAQRYGFLKKMMPAWVYLKVKKVKSRYTGEELLQIEIQNKTHDSVTFSPPVLSFKKGRKIKRYRIKGGDGQSFFPLTLMPGTGHKMVININRFRERIPELKKYKNLTVTIEADNGKVYKRRPNTFANLFG